MNHIKLAQLYYCSDKSSSTKLSIAKKVDVAYRIPDETTGKEDEKNFSGYNCLHIAASKSDAKLVNHFLSRRADIFVHGTFDGFTPLHVAINNYSNFKGKHVWDIMGLLQNDESINFLLSAHIQSKNALNPTCNTGVSHFHIACMINHVEAVKYFLKNGQSIIRATNATSHWPRYTPLHFAVRYSSVQVAEVLLKHGTNIHKKDGKGLSCLDLAIERLISIHDFMLMGKDAYRQLYKKEIQRIKKLISLMIKVMLKNKNTSMFVCKNGLTFLHLASMVEDSSILEDFFNMNVNLDVAVKSNSQFWPGWTPLHFAACISYETFQLLLDHGANITIKNAKGETPLDLCMRRFSPETIYSVLSKKIIFRNIMLSDNQTKLLDVILAMNSRETFDNFLQSLNNIDLSVPLDSPICSGCTLLHLAVSSKNKFKVWENFHKATDLSEFVALFSKHLIDIETDDTRYWDIVQECLTRGSKVSIQNVDGETPIHMAFNLCNMDLVTELLRYCKDDAVNSNNLSVFHIACMLDNADLMQRLLIKGADVNLHVKNEFQWYEPEMADHRFEIDRKRDFVTIKANSTALHTATMLECRDAVVTLTMFGADIHAKNSSESTPFHQAIPISKYTGSLFARLLISSTENLRESIDKTGLSHLHVAAFADCEKTIDQLVHSGANTEAVTSSPKRFAGHTPLRVAVDLRSNRAVKALIAAGANVHAENAFKKYETPLLHAVNELHQDSLLHFVEKVKLDDTYGLGVIDPSGLTSLHLACAALDFEWMKELLEKGADPNAQIRTDFKFCCAGFTPLHVVMSHVHYYSRELPERYQDFVELLLEFGADVTIKSNEKGTPLHMAYHTAFSIAYRWKDVDELTPFRNAAYSMLKRQKSYDVNPRDNTDKTNGLSHFHFACATNNVEIVEKFLECGVDIDHVVNPLAGSNGGDTGLHLAIMGGCADVARLLILRGANVNAEDSFGNTTFHTAMRYRFADLEFIKMFLKYGADINARNYENETPFFCLIHSSGLTLELFQFFLSYGCSVDMLYTKGTREGVLGLALKGVAEKDLASILKTLIKDCKLRNKIRNGFNAVHNIVATFSFTGSLSINTYVDIILRFIDMGCDIDQREIGGNTALHAAVSFHNVEAINALLQLGADINITGTYGKETPLTEREIGDTYSDKKIVKILAAHIWKMTTAGFDVHHLNKVNADRVHEKNPMDPEIQARCQAELIKMEGVKLDQTFTVRDFLEQNGIIVEYSVMPVARREAIAHFFRGSGHLRRKFPEFCGLLVWKYRQIQNRMKMWEEAKNALLFISRIQLPDLCMEAILRFFSKKDLKRLVLMVEAV